MIGKEIPTYHRILLSIFCVLVRTEFYPIQAKSMSLIKSLILLYWPFKKIEI